MLNQVPSNSVANQPRAIVTVNGTPIKFIDFEIDNNSYYEADTFRVEIPLFTNLVGVDYWGVQAAILVEIYAGFPQDPNNYTKSDLQYHFVGQTDDEDIDWITGLVTLHGRDLTAKLIDTKTTEKYPNLTSSQIATKLAQEQGLTPVVTTTTTKVGNYYNIDHAKMNQQHSEWDLLTYLAQEEGFNVYVKGMKLHFEPKADPNSDPYVLQLNQPTDSGPISFNGMHLRTSRNLTLAKDVIVKVRSWNSKNKKAYTKTAQATHNKNTVLAGAAQPIGQAQVYVCQKPGLTPQQTLMFAQQKLKELTAHEVKLHAILPGDIILGTQNVIQLKGTNSKFDQIYYPDSIIRTFNMQEGFIMTVDAKNHTPESEALV